MSKSLVATCPPTSKRTWKYVGKKIAFFCGLKLKCPARTDLKRNPIVQEYILPDLSTHRKGHVRQVDDIVTDTDQILVMNNERFTVPELVFRPDDIGQSFLDLLPAALILFHQDLIKAALLK